MPGRNDPCSCGSGKKYKKCCLPKAELHTPASTLEGKSQVATLRHSKKASAPSKAEIDPLVALFNVGLHADLEVRARLLIGQYPDSGFAWKLYAGALHMQRKDALAAFETAASLLPDDAETHFNFGVVLRAVGQLSRGEESYRRALKIRPNYAEAHSNLGNVLKDLGRLDEAVTSYRRALKFQPDDLITQGNLLSCWNFIGNQTAATGVNEARSFGALAARKARPYTAWPNSQDPARGLNVGWVSGDFREHAAGYFVENVLKELASAASERLNFFAYSNHNRSDAVTARIQSCCRGWYSAVGISDENLARQIHADGIDILIDLSGHTAHNRLPMFAWKPAPVQVSWLGYFATTGVAAIDYLIADPWTLPGSEEINFTETIWRLPDTRLCFTAPDINVGVTPLPALASGHVTFCCFNNLAKMNDAVVALWSRLLAALPHSVLFLKANQLNEAVVRQSVSARFAKHGVDAARIILEGPDTREKYLASYQRVDIALDPFPYPGGATSVEALWMGVPVLTLSGERFLSRQGVGLLSNAGLTDWIATDTDDYVDRAIFHASNLARLATLRSTLRQQVVMSPIFDAPRFARHFEAALREMWKAWCRKAAQG